MGQLTPLQIHSQQLHFITGSFLLLKPARGLLRCSCECVWGYRSVCLTVNKVSQKVSKQLNFGWIPSL